MVLEILIEEYNRHFDPFPRNNPKALLTLYILAEKVLTDLCVEGIWSISILLPSLSYDDEVEFIFSLEELNEAAKKDGILSTFDSCIRECLGHLPIQQIHGLELVGAASRTQCVSQCILSCLQTMKISYKQTFTLNRDEAIAAGCCLYAQYLAGRRDSSKPDFFRSIEALNKCYVAKKDWLLLQSPDGKLSCFVACSNPGSLEQRRMDRARTEKL